jgi:hypothetical protein
MTDVDALCAEYLKRLDTTLSDHATPQRELILEQITEHLIDARGELVVQSEAGVRSILERLGRPEDIAAAAAIGEDTVEPARSQWFQQRNRIQIISAVVVIAALGLTVGLLASKGSTSPRSATAITHPTTSTGHNAGKTVTVPVVVGQSIAQATAGLKATGLSVIGIAGDPVGLVVSQEPAGGSIVAPGSAITLHTQINPSSPVTSSAS